MKILKATSIGTISAPKSSIHSINIENTQIQNMENETRIDDAFSKRYESDFLNPNEYSHNRSLINIPSIQDNSMVLIPSDISLNKSKNSPKTKSSFSLSYFLNSPIFKKRRHSLIVPKKNLSGKEFETNISDSFSREGVT